MALAKTIYIIGGYGKPQVAAHRTGGRLTLPKQTVCEARYAEHRRRVPHKLVKNSNEDRMGMNLTVGSTVLRIPATTDCRPGQGQAAEYEDIKLD